MFDYIWRLAEIRHNFDYIWQFAYASPPKWHPLCWHMSSVLPTSVTTCARTGLNAESATDYHLPFPLTELLFGFVRCERVGKAMLLCQLLPLGQGCIEAHKTRHHHIKAALQMRCGSEKGVEN